MTIKLLTVVPAYLHRVSIQWDVTGSEAAHSHTFVVEKSGSPEGPWTDLSPVLTDAVTYMDEKANLFDFDRDIYYRIRSVDLATNGTSYSNVKNMVGDYDRRRYLLWRKMNYDEEIMLKKGNGVPLKILKRKHFGTRCSKCYDETTGMLVLSKCDVCLGTGWIAGYYAPISTWGKISPVTDQTSDTNPTSIVNVANSECFLLNYPQVQRNDLIIETLTNTRWRIESERPTELTRVTVHQDVTISKIPRDAVEYSIEV